MYARLPTNPNVHCGPPLWVTSREDDQRQRAERHLPGGERQHIDVMPSLHQLDDHGARRPGEAAEHGEHAAEHAVQLPRADHQHEAGERQAHGEPLHAAQAFAEEGPGEQQEPERHGVGEHRHPAGAAALQRYGGEPIERGGLQQADDQV